jgi:hypothetical protein
MGLAITGCSDQSAWSQTAVSGGKAASSSGLLASRTFSYPGSGIDAGPKLIAQTKPGSRSKTSPPVGASCQRSAPRA